MKRSRVVVDKDDEPLVFKDIKKTTVEDVLDTLEDEENLERGSPSICSARIGG